MCVRDRRILLKTRHNDQAENIEIIDGIETEKLQLFHEPDKRRRYRKSRRHNKQTINTDTRIETTSGGNMQESIWKQNHPAIISRRET